MKGKILVGNVMASNVVYKIALSRRFVEFELAENITLFILYVYEPGGAEAYNFECVDLG